MDVPSQPIKDRLLRIVWSGAGRVALIISLFVGLLYLAPLLAYAQSPAQGQAAFEQKCKSCHTIGGGRTVGPDLKGVTAQRDRSWLIEIIVAPDQLIGRGDPTATEMVKQYNGLKMPNIGVTPQEAEAVLAYIEQQSGGATPGAAQPGASPAPAAPSSAPQPAAAGDADAGRALFTGATGFANGGPPCMACHEVSGIGALGGGSMAKDLTTTYATLGEQGLASVLKTTPFPIMKEIYAGHGLTDQEVAHLLAFFGQTASAGQARPASSIVFLVLGAAGFLVLLGAISVFWARRSRGVRQALVRGGSR